MKKRFKNAIAFTTFITLFLSSCQKEKVTDQNHAMVSKVEAETDGENKNLIAISGSGFGTNAERISATFNGTAGKIKSVSDNQVLVEIPGKADRGSVTLNVAGYTLNSAPVDFWFRQQINLVAGTASTGFADGTGASAKFWNASAMASDAAGNMYVADYANHRIRKITADGTVTTIAGTGQPGFTNGAGNTAQFNGPAGIAIDPATGLIYVADGGNHCIRLINNGNVSTYAGTPGQAGFQDGNRTLSTTKFNSPAGMTFYNDELLIADMGNNRIRYITKSKPGNNSTTWQMSFVGTKAGSGQIGALDGAAQTAKFFYPADISADAQGALYIADKLNNKIRKLSNGVVSTIAGNGWEGAADGIGTSATFRKPTGITVAADGTIYVADNSNHRIRKIAGNTVSTYSGSTAGFQQGALTTAKFNYPGSVRINSSGVLYIGDFTSVRKVARISVKYP